MARVTTLSLRFFFQAAAGLIFGAAASAGPEVSRDSRPVYTLPQCIDLALEQNPDIAVARKRIEEAGAGVTVARSAAIPSLTASGRARQREGENAVTTDLRDERYIASVFLTQNLFSSGGVRGSIGIAKLIAEKRRLEYQAVVDRVVMEVRVGFYEVLYRQALVGIRQEAVSVLQEELKMQTARFKAGTVGEFNMRRAAVSVANEEPELIEAISSVQTAYIRLSALLGIPLDPNEGQVPFTILGGLKVHQPPMGLRDCLIRAEQVRPEIKARELEIAVETKQLIVDRSAILPRLDAFAGYQVYENQVLVPPKQLEPGVLPTPDFFVAHFDTTVATGYIVGVTASWQIFDGFATAGRLKATRARRDAAGKTLEGTKLDIQADVRVAFQQFEDAKATLATQAKNVDLARESLHLAQANMAAGQSSQLDVLQSAFDLTRSQTIQWRALYDLNVAVAKLQRAISDDWRNDSGPGTGANKASSPSFRKGASPVGPAFPLRP
jgi:outer membrane protein TolC